MNGIKPIETIYNGYRFRSRLEARWAVFFDALGVRYEYEPEGFELPSGRRYLPDFRVKCWGMRGKPLRAKPFDLWIEVKGEMTENDANKIKEFTKLYDSLDEAEDWNSVLIVGNIPEVNSIYDMSESRVFMSYDRMNGVDIYPFNYETIDGDHFAAYPAVCGRKFYLWGDDSNYIGESPENIEKMFHAYLTARQARFEHGETPRL